jgi:Lamin Tail Domain
VVTGQILRGIEALPEGKKKRKRVAWFDKVQARVPTTSSTTNVPAGPANTVISEGHYHPADPSTAEFNAGHTDADDFQFIELHNISATAVELAGSAFTQGVTFNFTTGTVLAPSGVLVLARNAAAFQMRYGFAPSGTFIGRLSHSNGKGTGRSFAVTTTCCRKSWRPVCRARPDLSLLNHEQREPGIGIQHRTQPS